MSNIDVGKSWAAIRLHRPTMDIWERRLPISMLVIAWQSCAVCMGPFLVCSAPVPFPFRSPRQSAGRNGDCRDNNDCDDTIGLLTIHKHTIAVVMITYVTTTGVHTPARGDLAPHLWPLPPVSQFPSCIQLDNPKVYNLHYTKIIPYIRIATYLPLEFTLPNHQLTFMDDTRFRQYLSACAEEPDGYGCHIWPGGRDVTIDGKRVRVTREAWRLANPDSAPLTRRDFICHKCNNPSCVNPKHLYKGTGTTNAIDRGWKGKPFGEYLGFKPY